MAEPTAVDIAVNSFSVLTVTEVAEFCAKMDARGVTVQVAVVFEAKEPSDYDLQGRELDD